MATVPDPRWRVLDASGNALVGCTMLVRIAGTTTPADIYRDANLTSPMTNPMSGSDASDAQGYFPQFFAEEGSTFDIVLKDSSGVTLPHGSLVSVPSLADDTGVGAILRDFGNSRLRISGTAGVVSIEAGDLVGDDSGGKMRLGGYAGTQADTMSLDAATINTTGTLTENSKKLAGVVATEGAFTGASTVDIALVGSASGYRCWLLEVIDIVTSGALDVQGLLSFDGGTSYYGSLNYSSFALDNTATASSSASASQWRFIQNLNNSLAKHKVDMRLRITTNAGVNDMPRFRGEVDNVGSFSMIGGHIGDSTIATPATHIRLKASTGTISGRYRLIPLRGFGES